MKHLEELRRPSHGWQRLRRIRWEGKERSHSRKWAGRYSRETGPITGNRTGNNRELHRRKGPRGQMEELQRQDSWHIEVQRKCSKGSGHQGYRQSPWPCRKLGGRKDPQNPH